MGYEAYLEQHGMPDWENDPFGVSFAGGETLAEFHHRVGRGLHRLVGANEGRTVVVVCHGGVIDAAFRTLLRLPTTGAFELRTTNTSLTELVRLRPGRWMLARSTTPPTWTACRWRRPGPERSQSVSSSSSIDWCR